MGSRPKYYTVHVCSFTINNRFEKPLTFTYLFRRYLYCIVVVGGPVVVVGVCKIKVLFIMYSPGIVVIKTKGQCAGKQGYHRHLKFNSSYNQVKTIEEENLETQDTRNYGLITHKTTDETLV